MAIDSAPADRSSAAGKAAPVITSSAPPSWPWRRAGLVLAGAAQLITISALVGADPITVTRSSLLLAVAPAPLAAAAVFAPAPVNLLAAVAGIAVLIVGIAGQLAHTRLFFVPVLAILAVGAVKLWRERAFSTAERAVSTGEGVCR